MRIITTNKELITLAEQCDLDVQRVPMSMALTETAYITFADKEEFNAFKQIVSQINPEALKGLAA